MSQRNIWIVVLLGVLAFVGCNQQAGRENDDTLTIGVSLLNLSNEFIVLLNESIQAKADDLGVRLIVNDAQRSAERQVQQVENFILQGVDAIILNPCEHEASSPAVDKAIAAGIPIVNVNSRTRSEPTAFVGSRDEESARIAMEYIAERLGGKGDVLMMHGFMGQTAQIDRERGAREVLAKYPDLTLVADQTAEWDRAKAITLMENWIQAHGNKMDAVFAQNDEMAMGAVIALEQAGMNDRVVVAGVDAIADALDAVSAGRLDATVFQDARGQGAGALETAIALVNGAQYEREVYIPFQLVTRENVATFQR